MDGWLGGGSCKIQHGSQERMLCPDWQICCVTKDSSSQLIAESTACALGFSWFQVYLCSLSQYSPYSWLSAKLAFTCSYFGSQFRTLWLLKFNLAILSPLLVHPRNSFWWHFICSLKTVALEVEAFVEKEYFTIFSLESFICQCGKAVLIFQLFI